MELRRSDSGARSAMEVGFCSQRPPTGACRGVAGLRRRLWLQGEVMGMDNDQAGTHCVS